MSFKSVSFDIEHCFNESLEAYRKNFLVLILASLTLFILGPLTLFILTGPLQAGFMMMILHSLKSEEKPKFDDLFKYLNRFSSLLIGFFVPAICSIIGLFFLVFPGIIIFTIWMYVLLLIVDKDLDVVDALKESYNLVINNNIWKHIILILIVIAIPLIVGCQQGPLGLILAILAYPLVTGLIVSAYNQLSGKKSAEVKNNETAEDEKPETGS